MTATVREQAAGTASAEAMSLCFNAYWRQQAGDQPAATALYARAVALAPTDPAILASAGDALRFTGELTEAVALFDRAIAVDPAMVAAWFGRALALDASGRTEDARAAYARVAELSPTTAPGFAGLAAMEFLLGDVDAARGHAAHALAIAPGDAMTVMTVARCDMAGGQHAAAAERLRRFIGQKGVAADDAIVALGLLGDAFDAMGRTDAAFDAYARANTRFVERHGGRDLPPLARREVEAIDAAVARLAPGALAGPAPAVAGEAARHIFLLGYPRSGTTLIEQVLATVPGVTTLEEAPTFSAAVQYLAPGGIAALAALGVDDVAALRADYWARVAAAGIDVAGSTFVDMDPFKAPALPLIARLFPDAKVVIVQRDARDVVWSCFRRSFVYSPVTIEFTTLPRAAQHYGAVMRLIRRCLDTLPVDAHVLTYEDLVHDFDGATQRLCDFAGLPWSPGLRDFARTASARPVKTASVHQVRRPLFDGSGQWRKYAAQLEPVMPVLAEWVAA
ncbi:tetratricopeptide repeat-containing sulfotransferase family protein [Glacieibacterium megasporae]|uniref:tetratricopeptide repeat-containing sulfotransferase family protein n=1 Tax=Glacieibacterium megasporae TaxID=2835787 RepID=UPI001C1E263D|nr:sulfotransferase [Polymorphobacter megasporae]UAJ11847.1 sulfotransferase [Polymorphobacter megasporae]